MNKKNKIIVTTAIALSLLILSYIIFSLWWNGYFDKVTVTDIVSFDSPDGNYCLEYQQIGDPEWPFGRTDVRLTLHDVDGHIINSVDTFIADDGCMAHENNIKSIEWTDDSVKVVLQASEMQDKEIILSFSQ